MVRTIQRGLPEAATSVAADESIQNTTPVPWIYGMDACMNQSSSKESDVKHTVHVHC